MRTANADGAVSYQPSLTPLSPLPRNFYRHPTNMIVREISQRVPAEFEKYKGNVFSQRGEDGVIEYVLRKMRITEGYFVEFGAWDGKHLSNCANLAQHGWGGCFVEGDGDRFRDLVRNYGDNDKIDKVNCFIVPEGENSLGTVLSRVGAPREFEILSIDIDGNDYLIWESLVAHSARLVVIEYNPTIPANLVVIQDGQDQVSFGSSLAALWELASRKGYRLVAATDWNAFFVKEEDCDRFEISSYAPWDLKDTAFETHLFHGYNGQIKLAGYRALLWHGVAIEESKVQVLPERLQRFPDGQDTEYLHDLSRFKDESKGSDSAS